MDSDPYPTPGPTPSFSDFKDAPQKDFSYSLLITYQQAPKHADALPDTDLQRWFGE